MKTVFNIKSIIALAILAISCFVLASSSGGGTGGGGSTGVGPIETSNINAEMCAARAMTLSEALSFNSVSLRYNFQNYINSTAALNADFLELAQIHPSMSSLLSGVLVGEINWLSDITAMANYVTDESRKPGIILEFSDVECQSIGYCFPETTVEPENVSGNTIYNVHSYSTPLSYIKYTIRSVKTEANHVQLVWMETIDVTGIIYDASSNANITGDLSVFATISTSVPDDSLAYRLGPEDQSIIIVDIGDDLTLDNLEDIGEWVIEPGPDFFSPDLDGPVYSGGDLNEDIEWEEPIILNEPRP